MTNREKQHRLDQLAQRYLAAVDTEDFDTIDALWEQAADDADLDAMLHGLNAELAAEQDAQEYAAVSSAVLDTIATHMPSAEVIRPVTGPLTVAEVAEHIRRHPPAGLTTDDLKVNDLLRNASEEVPAELGISQVVRWGARFGPAPEAYWRAFREVALDLWMERTSAVNYQLAARPKRPEAARGNAVNTADEKGWIARVVATLRSTCNLPENPKRYGPVPLERFLAEHTLRLVELPRLSRAAVFDYLLAKGSIPGELGEDEDLAGFLYITGPFGRVFVNADDPVPRRRFTAGHELGHFVLHRESMGGQVSFGDSPATVIEVEDETAAAMERQANRFAAELLMPAEVCWARAETFRKTYHVCPRTPFAYYLAAELVVSPKAMRYRLRDLAMRHPLRYLGEGDE